MRQRTTFCKRCACILLSTSLAGCLSPPALKQDYTGFAKSYGDASNVQMLLNLARLANSDPIYFLQLGSFSSQYAFNAGVGFTPSYVNNTPGFYNSSASATTGGTPPSGSSSVASSISSFVKHTLTLGGSATASVTETPIFQYLPLTGSNLVSAVMVPISDKVFYTFYEQGYHADLAARVMIESVEHSIVVPAITNNGVVQPAITKVEYWVNSPYDPSYANFLDFCSQLRDAQVSHKLMVASKEGNDIVLFEGPNEKLTDIVAAVQANLSVTNVDPNTGRIRVTQRGTEKELHESKGLGYPTLVNIFSLNTNTNGNRFTVDFKPPQTAASNVISFASGFAAGNTFHMRTVEAAMYCVAREEYWFRRLNATNGNAVDVAPERILYTNDAKGPFALVKHESGSQFLVRPLMKLTRQTGEDTPDTELVHTYYGDGNKQERYFVGDPPKEFQNRSVFAMLTYLFAQAAISTQNLPVQQLIQVH